MGKMIRCPEGHFYDTEKHSSCPICGVKRLDIGRTRGRRPAESPKTPKPVDLPAPAKPAKDEGKTLGFWGKTIDPVVGWLVCIQGPGKGKDYRIKSERNYIGRSREMDIYIANDQRISRKNHAIISYNPKKNTFKLLPGEGRALVYLNEEEVDSAKTLKAFDIIEIGESKFIFAPLCGENFQWPQET